MKVKVIMVSKEGESYSSVFAMKVKVILVSV